MSEDPKRKPDEGDRPEEPAFAAAVPTKRFMGPNPTLVSTAEVVTGDSIGPGVVVGGKYQLVRKLGEGGMGAVYEGEQLELHVPVAVKIMHGFVAAQPEYVERFRREARAALLLSHPNVVRVIDFGQHQETFFIVMELIQGENLHRWLDKRRGTPPRFEEWVPLLAGVLDALESAHAHGIVHRDLKPDNILLTADAQGQLSPKVVDFGLAHVEMPSEEGATLTRPDTVAGTPSYMSPEQSRSLRVGPSSDLYAIGCILTELLQLRPPFEGAPIEIVSQHMIMPPPPLERPADAEPVPALLEKLRQDLLAKHPHQRPASAAVARARLLEAVDPAAHAKRLPSRKGELPAGGRDERIPSWNEPSAGVSPAQEPVAATALLIAPTGSDLFDVTISTGLAAHRILPSRAEALPEPCTADVVALDAGDDLDAAVGILSRAVASKLRVLVIVAKLEPLGMRRLIEAGAADVMAKPVAPDVLAKKLGRLLRRRAG